jgi:uncharacterized protein (TIGR02001 family)
MTGTAWRNRAWRCHACSRSGCRPPPPRRRRHPDLQGTGNERHNRERHQRVRRHRPRPANDGAMPSQVPRSATQTSNDRGGLFHFDEEPQVMSSRKRAIAVLLCTSLAAAGHASAEVSGEVAIVSDYVFRGLSQTNEKPALQAGLTWEHESGFYIGTWGSSISWLSDSDPDVSSQVEIDVFAGYAGEFGESGVGYDVGVLHYWYPGRYPAGFNSPDTTGSASPTRTAAARSSSAWTGSSKAAGRPASATPGNGSAATAASSTTTTGKSGWANPSTAASASAWSGTTPISVAPTTSCCCRFRSRSDPTGGVP